MPSNPHSMALADSEGIVSELQIANVYKSMIMKIMNLEIKSLLGVINEVKDIQVEKMKIESAKELYTDVLAKNNERAGKLSEELMATRNYVYQLLTIIDKLAEKFNLPKTILPQAKHEESESKIEHFEKIEKPEAKKVEQQLIKPRIEILDDNPEEGEDL